MMKLSRCDAKIVTSFLLIPAASVQKPVVLTISGRTVNNINIYQYISDLTPAIGGQKNPTESGQGHWLFHEVLFFMQSYHWFTFFAYIRIIFIQKNIFGGFCKKYFLYTNLGIDFLIKSLTSDRLQFFSLFNS